jgi:diguanylate cyclase (GGDEF)-like protein/PAS domain S-box-containing protein
LIQLWLGTHVDHLAPDAVARLDVNRPLLLLIVCAAAIVALALFAGVARKKRQQSKADAATTLRNAHKRLQAVQMVARMVSSAPKLDQLFRLVIAEIEQTFGYQMVSIYLREADGLRLQAAIGYDQVMPFIRLDQGVSGRVARTGQPAFVSEASSDSDFIEVAPGTRQAIAAPLRQASGEVLGTLLIESTGEPQLTSDDYNLILTLADQISVSIANVRLIAELSSSEERFRSIIERSPIGIAIVMDGKLLLANPAHQQMFGYASPQAAVGARLLDAVDPVDHAALLAALNQAHEASAGSGMLSIQAVRADQSRFPYLVSISSISLAEGRASVLSGTDITGRVQAQESLARLARQRQRLLEVAQQMVGTLTPEAVLERFPAALTEVINYTAFEIYFVDEERRLLCPALFEGPESLRKLEHWPIPLGAGIIGHVALTGQGELIADTQDDPRAIYPDGFVVQREHSILIPLRAQDRIFGVCAFMRLGDVPFSTEDYELAELFINYTALAITNARLFDDTQRSEARFRAALNGSLDDFFVFKSVRDQSGAIVDFIVLDLNTSAERVFGKPRAQVLGRRLLELLPVAAEHGIVAKYADVVEHNCAREEEYSYIQPDGMPGWRYHNIVPLADGVAVTSRDITERRQAEDALMKLATLDVLTGVLNRRHFFVLAESELARVQRYNHSLAVVMLDIDHFKAINDAYGHLMGDRVLQSVASACRSQVRTVDLLGRYGGEEFIFLLPETDLQGALQTAERLRATIAQIPVVIDGSTLHLSVSVGIAVHHAGDGAPTLDMLVERADQAMYQAKHAGRDRVMVNPSGSGSAVGL